MPRFIEDLRGLFKQSGELQRQILHDLKEIEYES